MRKEQGKQQGPKSISHQYKYSLSINGNRQHLEPTSNQSTQKIASYANHSNFIFKLQSVQCLVPIPKIASEGEKN